MSFPAAYNKFRGQANVQLVDPGGHPPELWAYVIGAVTGTVTMTGRFIDAHGNTVAVNPNAGNRSLSVNSATNANPASLSVTAHGWITGNQITISGGTGNWAAANGTWSITVTDANDFTIPVNSTAFGAVTGSLVAVAALVTQVTLSVTAGTPKTISQMLTALNIPNGFNIIGNNPAPVLGTTVVNVTNSALKFAAGFRGSSSGAIYFATTNMQLSEDQYGNITEALISPDSAPTSSDFQLAASTAFVLGRVNH